MDTNSMDQIIAQARRLRNTYYQLMDCQNAPIWTDTEDGSGYTDDFYDDPELDAEVAAADAEFEAFLTGHRGVLSPLPEWADCYPASAR